VINIHWTSANVNFIVDDCAKNVNTCVVDSKDAKSIVPGDIAPVQKPMKTWKQRSGILPDHDWEQGRANAVTPMAHLFLETSSLTDTEQVVIPLTDSAAAISVTRTGQAINLIYLSHYEPETVFRCFNELFFLLVQPSLDRFFRNPETGQIKENFVFIVDNGPAEQPSSSMVQMCLARLCNFLNLDKVIQVSFAEYHSKRNFVERVHPQVNRALSAHGAFSSHEKYPDAREPGKSGHLENMEHMAAEVIDCVKSAKFGGKYIETYRGLKEEERIFVDEKNVSEFLSMSEFNKEVSGMSYQARRTPLAQSLHDVWGIDIDFKGEYWKDYCMVKGEEDEKSSWCDKYTTVVFRKGDDWRGRPQQRFHRQPLPDFIRWLTSGGELHYLPYELRSSLPTGRWDSVPGCYLPSHVLNLAYVLMAKPTGSLLRSLALLCWVSEQEVLKFFEDKDKEIAKEIYDAKKREQWKRHRLYGEKKDKLARMCRDRNLEPSGLKHEMVERLALAEKEKIPDPPPLFDGSKKLPKATKEIARLPICYLQSVLSHMGLPACGTKDELVLRVSLLANDRKYLCFNKESKMFLELISITKELILEERRQTLLADNIPKYRRRAHSTPMEPSLSSDRPRYHAAAQTQVSTKARVDLPLKTTTENVHEIFEKLLQEVSTDKRADQKIPESAGKKVAAGEITNDAAMSEESSTNTASILQEGAKVKVFWNAEDVKDTGWHEGWYMAVVKEVIDKQAETARIVYVVEPSQTYEISVKELLEEGMIKIYDGDEIEQFYEVGARIKVKWTKEEIGDTNWRPGWYVGEVQGSDADQDEITVKFVAEPESTYTYEVTPCVAEGKIRIVKPVF